MWFWWFMFFCNLLYPGMMILGGWFMWKAAPGINGVAGYRSRRSRLSQEAWDFAQVDCGKRWYLIGKWMLVPVILAQLPFYHANEETVGNVTLVISVVAVAIMLLSIPLTEKRLKENFDEKGRRKSEAEIRNDL